MENFDERSQDSSSQLTARPAPNGDLRHRRRSRPDGDPSGNRCRAVEIPPLGPAPGRRQVVAERVAALGGVADSLGDLGGDPLPHGALSFAQFPPVNDRIVPVGVAPGVVGDQAKEVRARNRDWRPIGRRWWPVIAHGSPLASKQRVYRGARCDSVAACRWRRRAPGKRRKEAIVHLAFYAGWPKAMSAIQVAKQVFAE